MKDRRFIFPANENGAKPNVGSDGQTVGAPMATEIMEVTRMKPLPFKICLHHDLLRQCVAQRLSSIESIRVRPSEGTVSESTCE